MEYSSEETVLFQNPIYSCCSKEWVTNLFMKKILFIPTMWKRESMCKRENRKISEERERERWKGFGRN